MTVASRALATIRKHQMLPPGGRVLVALSGGPDSVALVHLLRELESAGLLVIAALAHVNHQLRGAAAEADEAFCRRLAADLSLAIEVERADVRGIARTERRSLEDAARRLRYTFLEAARGRANADAIATGHSLDDQAETFLLRVLRGAGTRGLGGIRPRAGRVIRPLIEIRRHELRQYAAERGLKFQEDATNLDLTIPRNRVRHELLPYLAREFSPGIAEVLAREASLAQDDDDRLHGEAIEIASSVVLVNTVTGSDGVRQGPTGADGVREGPAGSDTVHHGLVSVTIDALALLKLHPALASRVAMEALRHLAGRRFVGAEHVARFLAFAREARPGQALSLPGQQALHGGATVRLRAEPARMATAPSNFSSVQLSVPGEVVLGGWQISADGEARPASDEPRRPSGPDGVLVAVDGPLAVRFRRPGDRFEPPGMGGRSKKLQDYFVDRKVSRNERDRLPLVVDGLDRIVWVVGHGVAEGVRAPAASPGVILLKARRLGGEG